MVETITASLATLKDTIGPDGGNQDNTHFNIVFSPPDMTGISLENEARPHGPVSIAGATTIIYAEPSFSQSSPRMNLDPDPNKSDEDPYVYTGHIYSGDDTAEKGGVTIERAGETLSGMGGEESEPPDYTFVN